MTYAEFFENIYSEHLIKLQELLERKKEEDKEIKKRSLSERITKLVEEEKKLDQLRNIFQEKKIKYYESLEYKDAFQGFVQQDNNFKEEQGNAGIIITCVLFGVFIIMNIVYHLY